MKFPDVTREEGNIAIFCYTEVESSANFFHAKVDDNKICETFFSGLIRGAIQEVLSMDRPIMLPQYKDKQPILKLLLLNHMHRYCRFLCFQKLIVFVVLNK